LLNYVSEGCSIETKAYGGNDYYDTIYMYGYLKLNGVTVWQSSFHREYPNERGATVFIVDMSTCTLAESRTYDTLGDVGAAAHLRDYLQGLSIGTVLVGISADEASTHLDAAEATLSALGADVSDVGYRGAWTFVAEIGDPYKTVLDKELTEASAMARQPVITTFLERTYFDLLQKQLS